MSSEEALAIIVSLAAAALLAVVAVGQGLVPVASTDLTPLARFYLLNVYNGSSQLWGASPEVITSILWDYRGLDTVYETAVFFLAIIATLTLFRDAKLLPETAGSGRGMTVIVKTVTRITFVTIPIIAASIALHGHLTPGGGFQGGAAFGVAPLLLITAFSLRLAAERGWSKGKLLTVRTAGLLAIGLIAVSTPYIIAALGGKAGIGYVMQNQPKAWAEVGWPYAIAYAGMRVLFSGTLLFLNLAELFAVSAGLALVFTVIAMPTEVLEKGGGVKK